MAAHLIDSHTHLDDEQFDADREEVIRRAMDAGVERMVTVGSLEGTAGAERSVEIASRHEGIRATVGIHPHDARLADTISLERIATLARHPRVVALGETGLDYYYDHSPRPRQREVFRKFIAMAKQIGKPLVIHSRDAMDDTLRIMDEEDGWETGGVFHCYSGDLGQANRIVNEGFYISFAGVLTFKNARRAREIAGQIPRDRTLVETDAPYLAPVPHRGHRNEPAHVTLVAEKMAEIWDLPYEDVCRITAENTERLFGLG